MKIEDYFAEYIKPLVDKRGRGYQAALAKALHIERGVLNNYLSGVRKTKENLRREMCKEMGLDYDEIIKQYHESMRDGTTLPATFKDGLGRDIKVEDAVRMMEDIMSGPDIYKVALMTSVKALFRAGRNEMELEIMKGRMDGFEQRMEAREDRTEKMFAAIMSALTPQKGASQSING